MINKIEKKLLKNCSKSETFLLSIYLKATIYLFIIFIFGALTNIIMFSSGILRALNGKQFDMQIYEQVFNNTVARNELYNIGLLSIISIVCILVSAIFKIIWSIKLFWTGKLASKTFINLYSILFTIGQGASFGIIFATWNSWELMLAFLITSLLFGFITIFSWKSKITNINSRFPISFMMISKLFLFILLPLLIFSIIFKVTNLINMISFFIFVGMIVLLPMWIIFDIWLIKNKINKLQIEGMSEEEEYNWTNYLAFSILYDFITMFWYFLRIIGAFNK